MSYLFITAGVFLLDFIIKSYMDKKYARKVQHPRLNGAIILEKYYNRGAALNLLSQKPKILKFLHSLKLQRAFDISLLTLNKLFIFFTKW